MAEDNSAASGGLLVILGIVVALGAVYFFASYSDRSSADITIRAEVPTPANNN